MHDPLERLLIGRSLLGRYTVEEVIGGGGMSIVYRARDERLSRPVALKILRLPGDLAERDRGELRERLRREAAAAATISSHPNVVQIFDYGTDPELDLDFIAMELLQGSDLKERLRQGPIGPAGAHRILREMARGLSAGHRAGIVHRDVKPANIFLVGHEDLELVKVLDFGIAKAFATAADDEDDLTRDGRLPHSPAYASPEQLDPARTVTPASDVFQLGLVGYELFAGERPFTEDERARLRANVPVRPGAHGRWNQVPAGIRSTIERALAPDPADRFPDAAAFASALGPPPAVEDGTILQVPESQAVQDHTVLAPPSPVAHPSARGGRDLRKIALAAVSIAVLALLAWAAFGAITSGGDAAPAEEAAAESNEPAAPDLDVEELEGDFRDLVEEAFERLTQSLSAEEGEEAAAAVQQVIGELQQTWVRGDLDRHVGFYADIVDFRGTSGADRDRIASIRQASIEEFPEREIWVDGLAIEFIAPGRARALVDRRWRFEGEDIWRGKSRDEMVLVKEDERWLVVSEQELESFSG